jgi:hypothetical protein
VYQVTAIYEDAEIGYGEGEGLVYGIEDCLDSVPTIFHRSIFDGEVSPSEVQLSIINEEGVKFMIYLSDYIEHGATV